MTQENEPKKPKKPKEPKDTEGPKWAALKVKGRI